MRARPCKSAGILWCCAALRCALAALSATRRRTAAAAGLAVDPRDVSLDGRQREGEMLSDLGVAESRIDEPGDLAFARRQRGLTGRPGSCAQHRVTGERLFGEE